MTPELSIVIPTRARPGVLVRTLSALARQNVPRNTFETIVVADGEDEDCTSEARALDMPFDLSLLSQPRSGAAAARNRGIKAATAPVLLFLDDDMLARPGLVAEHLARHSEASTDVVLGHFTQATEGLSDPFFAAYVRAWWSGRFMRMAEPAHRFGYDDLFSGHFSVRRDLISALGGFEEGYSHEFSGEDYELAVRLLSSGARFVFAPRATAVHMDDPTVQRALRRAFADGRGHTIMVRKHPEMLTVLPLRAALRNPSGVPFRRAQPVKAPPLPLAVARRLKLRRLWSLVFGRANLRAYWSGVLTELGSYAELRRLIQEAHLSPTSRSPASFDVRSGPAALVEVLANGSTDSLDIWVGETPICRLLSGAGAEGLRPGHVADHVSRHFAWDVVAALGARGSTLDGPIGHGQVGLGVERGTEVEAAP